MSPTPQSPNADTLDSAVRDAILEAVVRHDLTVTAEEAAHLIAAVATTVRSYLALPAVNPRRPEASKTRQAQHGSSTRSPIRHGTPQGYRGELRRGVPACEDCRAAYNVDQKFRRSNPVAPRQARIGIDRDDVAAQFAGHTRRDGEHLIWTGPIEVPTQGQRLTPFQASWAASRSRLPQGNILRTCDREGCVDPRHIADRRDRDLERAVLGAGHAV